MKPKCNIPIPPAPAALAAGTPLGYPRGTQNPSKTHLKNNIEKRCLKVPPRVSQGTPKGTKNAQKSSVEVPWEGLGRHLRNSCKKRAPLEGRTCNPLMPVQSKHSFQCSDFSYFWHQICPTLGSSWEHLPPKFTKVPLQSPPPKPLKNHFKITSKIDANGE